MRVVLGHNQFIGISHISEDKSREKEKLFSNVENIYRVVEKASQLGYRDMVIETHPRMLEFLRYYEKNKTFDMNFFLQLPSVRGYVQKMNENGLRGLVVDLIRRAGFLTTARVSFGAAYNYLRKDYTSLALSAFRFEVKPFRRVEINSLLLHNVLTDLLLSLNGTELISELSAFAEGKLGQKMGFITLNFPKLVEMLKEAKVTPAWIMTPINPLGFDMNPSKEAVEKAISSYQGKVIAMNILAGGAVSMKESASYLKSLKNIDCAVVGASLEAHLKESYDLLR